MKRFKNILSWSEKQGEINYFFIKKIQKSNYKSDYGVFSSDLKVHLAKDISDNDSYTVEFRNITSVNFDLSQSQFAGLAIDDISNRCLEKCNFRVYTYESNDIDFYCEDIKVIKNAT